MYKLTPKLSSRARSLYLVVSEEKIMPNPRENKARNIIRIGDSNAHRLGCTTPLYRKKLNTIKNSNSCIPNLIKLEIIVAIGDTNLGK